MFGQFGGQVVSTGNLTFCLWCAPAEVDLRLSVLLGSVGVKLGHLDNYLFLGDVGRSGLAAVCSAGESRKQDES